MSVTVIDRLIVELGLDPKQFTKGSKEAAAAVVATEGAVTKSARSMISGLRRVAAEFVSLFLVVRSVHDVVGIFAELNENVRQLGIDSRNFDESAAHLRDWGNIAEIAGGQAEDAVDTISGLQKAIFNVGHGLGWSDQLTEFGRIGVDTGVATGKMRDFHDLLLDTSRALQQQFPDRAQRFQETQVLGLKGGIANAVADGPNVLEKYYQQQLKIHQTTEGDTRAAQQLAQAWDMLRDKMRALTTQILTAVSPALQKMFNGFGNFLSKHQSDFEKGITDIGDWASGPGPGNIIDAFGQIADAAVSLAHFVNDTVEFIKHPVNTAGQALEDFGAKQHQKATYYLQQHDAEQKAGLPEGLLRAPGLPQDIDPFQAANALKTFHQQEGGDVGDPNWVKTVAKFKARTKPVEGAPNTTALQATQGAGPSPRAQSVLAGSKPTADTGTRGNTTVTTGPINVYTQATDAEGMARDASGALKRKLTVSLSDGALS